MDSCFTPVLLSLICCDLRVVVGNHSIIWLLCGIDKGMIPLFKAANGYNIMVPKAYIAAISL